MTYYLEAVEKLLTGLIPAIEEIGNDISGWEFVDLANEVLEKMNYEYRYLFDMSNDDVLLMITDGFGNLYPARCDKCGLKNHVVRPGKFQCPNGCARG